MKKLMLIAVVGLFLGSLTSCTKDYTCTCVDADGTTVETTDYLDSSKGDAEDACTAKSVDGLTCTLND